ncbi:MAG: flagellar hook-associated protein FlgK, partial [Candidatus Kerfeldbacteria bacterium]|nr:flagellar hook-associated protein FlgK [Candidatus Kerfeldbacteria bacterium]
EVTGQNIANVQTEGFSRQEVSFEATSPRSTGQGILGTGVKISAIQRAHNQFIFGQITDEEIVKNNYTVRKDSFDQLEVLFNQNTGGDLSGALNNFFASVQDLSTNPTGLAERATMLARGQSLELGLNQMRQKLFQQQQNLDQTVDTKITEINNLTTQIAALNKNIHGSETGTLSANDLRDQRDKLIRTLSQKIDVNIMSEVNGQMSLTLKNGRALVLGNTAFTVSAQVNGDNNGFKDVMLDDGAGNRTNVTSIIQGGELRGLIDMRDTEVGKVRDQLDRLTAGFVREFNRVHQNGQGLDGQTGRNFFTPLSATVLVNTNNTGSGNVAVANASPATASVDKYEFTFTAANTVSLRNLTTGQASGTFTFATGTAFNVAVGLAVTITGSAAVGDRFRFSLSENASSTVSVDSQIVSDTRKIAAGKTSLSDGGNALDLAALQRAFNFDGTSMTRAGSGSYTFNDFYSSIVANLGVSSQTTQTTLTEQEGILTQLKNRRESSDGVSLDEEMINMVKFQQAYNASARVLSVVNDLFTTLQNKI